LAGIKERRSGHDPGRVVRDLAVMLADGGDCLTDLGGLRDQQSLVGPVASNSTAFRVIERIAEKPALIDARARARAWRLGVKPGEATIDIDATLLVAHSKKHGADGNYKGGYGFHPMLAYLDQTGEALAVRLRPDSSGSNDAADQIVVGAAALALIPAEQIESLEILLRVDSAGATHELIDWCREGQIRYSVGYDLTEPVQAAILQLPENAWVPALDQDGTGEGETGRSRRSSSSWICPPDRSARG
jgi:Transposase DDE domain group 1